MIPQTKRMQVRGSFSISARGRLGECAIPERASRAKTMSPKTVQEGCGLPWVLGVQVTSTAHLTSKNNVIQDGSGRLRYGFPWVLGVQVAGIGHPASKNNDIQDGSGRLRDGFLWVRGVQVVGTGHPRAKA